MHIMKEVQLSELEKEIIDQCNELANPHNLTVGKFKIKRSIKYCITLDGYDILNNEDLIKVHKFCQNENDLVMLSQTAVSMVKNFKEKEAQQLKAHAAVSG